MENIKELSIFSYYQDFINKSDYMKRFEREFKAELEQNPEAILFDFENKELDDDFLKEIFSFIFKTTELKVRFFIRNCKEKNMNLIKILFESYKITSKQSNLESEKEKNHEKN